MTGSTGYYEEQLRYLRFLVPERLSILEIGCGLGDQLAALKPQRRLGIDVSAAMINLALHRHPEVEFRAADIDELHVTGNLRCHLIARCDRASARRPINSEEVSAFCGPHTRVIVVKYDSICDRCRRAPDFLCVDPSNRIVRFQACRALFLTA